MILTTDGTVEHNGYYTVTWDMTEIYAQLLQELCVYFSHNRQNRVIYTYTVMCTW